MSEVNGGLCWVGRHAQMGLGTMLEEFCAAMHPERVINIDCQDRRTPSVVPVDNMVTVTRKQWERDLATVLGLLRGMKVIVGVETFFREDFPLLVRSLNARSVIFPMWEWSSDSIHNCDLIINLSEHDQAKYNGLKADWPKCPAVHDPNRVLNWPPKTFVHCAGNAHHNRDGTKEVLLASKFLENTGAKLIVYANFKVDGYEPSPWLEVRPSVRDRRDLFVGADCIVCPRGLPGHSLPINEATGEGIPVIVMDLPDWRAWPYRVSAYQQGSSSLAVRGGSVPLWGCDSRELGKLMRSMADGLVERKPCPSLPTWDEFKQQWVKWTSTLN